MIRLLTVVTSVGGNKITRLLLPTVIFDQILIAPAEVPAIKKTHLLLLYSRNFKISTNFFEHGPQESFNCHFFSALMFD